MAILARIRSYAPEVGGNRKLPENEQIKVHLKSVSVRQKQVQLAKFIGMDPDKLVKSMMEDKGSSEIYAILKENVVRFENLDLQDEAGTLVSATLDDVWNMGEFELCMELFNSILGTSQLKKEEEKNSELPSGMPVTPAIH